MNNTKLAHTWAHQTKSEGKGSNFFFEGPTIYSYGYHFPISTIYQGIYFVTTKGYSNSTAKHISYTMNAIPHGSKIIHLADIPFRGCEVLSCVKSELNKLDGEFNHALPKVFRARVNDPLRKAKSMLANISLTVEIFGLEELIPLIIVWENKLNSPDLIEQSKRVSEAKKKAEKEEEEEREAQRLAQKEEQLKRLSLWLAGGSNIHLSLENERIRRVGDIIQTSKGLDFSIHEARKLFKAIPNIKQRDKIKISDVEYSVSCNDDKEFVIGCHRFLKEHFKEFEGVLK